MISKPPIMVVKMKIKKIMAKTDITILKSMGFVSEAFELKQFVLRFDNHFNLSLDWLITPLSSNLVILQIDEIFEKF